MKPARSTFGGEFWSRCSLRGLRVLRQRGPQWQGITNCCKTCCNCNRRAIWVISNICHLSFYEAERPVVFFQLFSCVRSIYWSCDITEPPDLDLSFYVRTARFQPTKASNTEKFQKITITQHCVSNADVLWDNKFFYQSLVLNFSKETTGSNLASCHGYNKDLSSPNALIHLILHDSGFSPWKTAVIE